MLPAHMCMCFGELDGLLSIKPFHDSCCTNNLVYCLCPKERETCPVFMQEQIPSQSSHNRQQAPSVSHQPLAAMFSQPKITEKMVGVGGWGVQSLINDKILSKTVCVCVCRRESERETEIRTEIGFIARSSQCLSTHNNNVGQWVFLKAASVVSGCCNDDRFLKNSTQIFSYSIIPQGGGRKKTFYNETTLVGLHCNSLDSPHVQKLPCARLFLYSKCY